MADVLDNPIWHALAGPHASFALGGGRAARRYDPEVSVFAAADVLDESAWASLAELAGPEGTVVLSRGEGVDVPSGWTALLQLGARQMVLDTVADLGATDGAIRALGPADVPAMLDLVELARPGPFRRRTIELGRYVGVVEDGVLLAMAGERMRFDGHTEISAVCTHPDARGRGLAAAVTADVARSILARGDRPILHVADTNEPAIALYRRLGFTHRADLGFIEVAPPS